MQTRWACPSGVEEAALRSNQHPLSLSCLTGRREGEEKTPPLEKALVFLTGCDVFLQHGRPTDEPLCKKGSVVWADEGGKEGHGICLSSPHLHLLRELGVQNGL